VYGDRPKEVKTEIKYKGRDVKLDQEQIDYFQDKYNELSKKGLEALKKSAEYKAVDRETQVEAEAQLQRLMMKKSEEMLTKKYRNEFLRIPVPKEKPQEKKVKERLKQMIKRGF
jgi:maltodextrin utilization protein YvdJ